MVHPSEDMSYRSDVAEKLYSCLPSRLSSWNALGLVSCFPLHILQFEYAIGMPLLERIGVISEQWE